MKIFALVVGIFVLFSPQPKLTLNPHFCMAPCEVQISAYIYSNPSMRYGMLSIEGPNTYQSIRESSGEGLGWEFKFKALGVGEYFVDLASYDSKGSRISFKRLRFEAKGETPQGEEN